MIKRDKNAGEITAVDTQSQPEYLCGFVIPNYNHHNVIESTVASLVKFEMPIIIVDDGSQQKTQLILNQIEIKHSNVTLIRRETNGGKGAAVKTGMQAAIENNWSHALQIDADGQHDLSDVEKLLALSKSNPLALISGAPSYDASISKGRYYGRFITHFWVYLETLSTDIKDSMCGFRVYPLKSYHQLISKSSLGDKMDFDIEIMVKMYWQGVSMQFMSTKVHYPEDGISHFNLFQDNLLISIMHTRLFFGMLLRFPQLLWFKIKRKRKLLSNENIESNSQ